MSEIRLLKMAAEEAYHELQKAYAEMPIDSSVKVGNLGKLDEHLRKINEWLYAMKEQH